LSPIFKDQLLKDKTKLDRRAKDTKGKKNTMEEKDKKEIETKPLTDYLLRLTEQFEMMTKLRDVYDDSLSHSIQSLDDAYYGSLSDEDLANRDCKQVVTRYLLELESQVLNQDRTRPRIPPMNIRRHGHLKEDRNDAQLEELGPIEGSGPGQDKKETAQTGNFLEQTSVDIEKGNVSPENDRNSDVQPEPRAPFRIRLLVVPQFWMWKIDNSIICSPRKSGSNY
jgi:hypothetical protein